MPELKVSKKRPPRCRAPSAKGCPCAACLDGATAELDLAEHKQRALPWDSNSPRRNPLARPSCSARHMGNNGNSLFRQFKKIRLSTEATEASFSILLRGLRCTSTYEIYIEQKIYALRSFYHLRTGIRRPISFPTSPEVINL